MAKPIVVTGATGTVGSQVVSQLLAEGAAVRAAVRDPSRLPATPGLEAVGLDFSRPDTLQAAMAGADHLFLLTALVSEMLDLNRALVDAAKTAGIEHVVKLSALGAGPKAILALGRWHTEAEQYLERSGLGFTHLRPNSFMQNYLTYHGLAIKDQSAFFLPDGNGKISLIDVRDVAAVAVKALLEPGHMGKAYELTGPEALDNSEVAAILSETLGREIRYVDVPGDKARKAMLEMGSPEVMVDLLMGLNNIIREGRTAAVCGDVQEVLGRPARSLAEFAADHAAAWR